MIVNMKKYIFGLAVLAGGLFASCDTDNIGAEYSSTAQNISFETEEPATVVTDATSTTVPVNITRSNTVGEYTAHYTLEAEDASFFTDKNGGSATFADGEWKTTIYIDVANMEIGESYECTLSLSDADVMTADTVLDKSNITTTYISVMRDYEWLEAGKCLFIDSTWEAEPAQGEITIEHATGTNLYRFVNPMSTLYSDCIDSNIVFTYNSDSSISFGEGVFGTFDGRYMLYYDTGDFADYCYIQQQGNVYYVNCLLLYGSSLYLAGFAFQWTEGWPGE